MFAMTLLFWLAALLLTTATARDVKCDRWTDAHGRNLMKCDYVDAASTAPPPAAPSPPPVAQQPAPAESRPLFNSVRPLPPPAPIERRAIGPRPPLYFRFGPFTIVVH
jgi:hypothetical protein